MGILTKYLDLEGVATTPVGEILKDMDEIGAGHIALTVRDRDERTVGGLIVLRGPDADRYMRAIEAVEKAIEAEEDAVSNPFANADGVGTVDVAGRLGMVERFDLDQCRAGLTVPHLQKTVEKKLRSRIRKLEKEAAAHG
ncbi:hypothetical protein [Pseudomonas sp.]|uniref:hypothetical protein n=1 Tax=Pseudomonas sp. TaxID=306 RepID=UPI003D12133C